MGAETGFRDVDEVVVRAVAEGELLEPTVVGRFDGLGVDA